MPKDSILGRNVSRMSRFLIICCILIVKELNECDIGENRVFGKNLVIVIVFNH